MKPLKLGLRIWIAVTSIISFLGGWALFSHAGKPAPLFPTNTSNTDVQAASPVQSTGPSVMPTLPPIPSLDQLTSGSASAVSPAALQPLPQIQQSAPRTFFPRMRTRGS